MCGAVPPLPNAPSWRGAQLGGAQGQLYPMLCMFKSYVKRETLNMEVLQHMCHTSV